jgi:hypothetical protein
MIQILTGISSTQITGHDQKANGGEIEKGCISSLLLFVDCGEKDG